MNLNLECQVVRAYWVSETQLSARPSWDQSGDCKVASGTSVVVDLLGDVRNSTGGW
jgi:hypothetical protein